MADQEPDNVPPLPPPAAPPNPPNVPPDPVTEPGLTPSAAPDAEGVAADQPSPWITLVAAHRRQADEWALLLSAVDVRFRRQARSRTLFIAPEDAERAQAEIARYQEQAAAQPAPADLPPDEPPSLSSLSLVVALLLLAFYLRVGPPGDAADPLRVGLSDADHVRAGEYWRAVTALTLHADLVHVLSNAIGCLLLGGLVCNLFGEGVGWLLIVLAGAAANLTTAAILHPHSALGASGSVFGAVGLLGGAQITRNLRLRLPVRHSFAVPVLAVLLMVTFWGIAPGTDIMAHFWGAAWGVVLGLSAGFWWPRRHSWGWQVPCGLVTAALVAISWRLATGG